jgi:ASC-1-like (ASCH) protein
MAQIKDRLEVDVLEKLKKNQSLANESITNLGQIDIRVDELKTEMKELELYKETILNQYKSAVETLNTELKKLEEIYPTGQIDLVEGVVIFDDGK